MTRRIVTVPLALIRATSVNWDIDSGEQSAGLDLAGGEQIFFNAFPRWTGTLTLPLNRAQMLQWQAIRSAARGLGGIYRVYMPHRAALNLRAVGGDAVVDNGVPFANGSYFSNGQGFLYIPLLVTAAAAPKGATEIVVTEPDTPAVVGLPVSYEDWPMRITYRLEGATNVTLGVEPPLRTAIPKDAPISMVASGLFQATSKQSGAVETGPERIARPQLTLREWITRT